MNPTSSAKLVPTSSAWIAANGRITLCAQWYSMYEKIVAPVGFERL